MNIPKHPNAEEQEICTIVIHTANGEFVKSVGCFASRKDLENLKDPDIIHINLHAPVPCDTLEVRMLDQFKNWIKK